MGEPLNNPLAVSQALQSMTDAHAFALSPNFVTVSTVAPSPAHVRRFLDMPKAKIAWSVHGATDKMRRALVPTTSSTMVELREAFREVMAQRGDTDIFIECTLIEGVNDALTDVEALVEFLRPFGKEGVKINLIPYNDTGVNGWKPSPWETILAFQAHVRTQGGWPTFVRTATGEGRVECMRPVGDRGGSARCWCWGEWEDVGGEARVDVYKKKKVLTNLNNAWAIRNTRGFRKGAPRQQGQRQREVGLEV